MKSKYVSTSVGLLALVGVIFLAVQYGGNAYITDISGTSSPTDATPASDLVGAQAPYFDLPDLRGNHLKLSDFIGTPVVLVFWSTVNGTAADQIQILDQYLADHGGDGLVKIIAIDSQEDTSVVASYIRRGGYSVPTLIDTQGSVSEGYRIKSLPTLYFLDRTGTVRSAYAGVLSERQLVDKIEQIIQ